MEKRMTNQERQEAKAAQRARAQVGHNARLAAVRAHAAAGQRTDAGPQGQPLTWTFEDELGAGQDALSPTATEFVLNLLEGVTPNAMPKANHAVLDVVRTKLRLAVLRGHGVLFCSSEPHAEQPKESAPAQPESALA